MGKTNMNDPVQARDRLRRFALRDSQWTVVMALILAAYNHRSITTASAAVLAVGVVGHVAACVAAVRFLRRPVMDGRPESELLRVGLHARAIALADVVLTAGVVLTLVASTGMLP